MSFRIDRGVWETLSSWFQFREIRHQNIDEIHEAHDTQARLISFELRFAEFVEILATAQEYGVTFGNQARYETLRHQLAKSYISLRPFLLAYIKFDVEDERVGIRTVGAGTDAFEAIWVAPNLQSFIDSHDVFFRDRVGRANDALRDYNEHLHCLLETSI